MSMRAASDHDTLPRWPGADAVYRRVGLITKEMGRREYAGFLARKRPLKSDRFAPSQALTALIDAMNRGDEEVLKAALHEHRALLVEAEAREPKRIAA